MSADAFPSSVSASRGIRVCHIMSADLWAGAEVQVATVASYLVERPDVDLTAVLLNEGPLACELRRLGVPVTIVAETQTSALGILTFLTRFLRDHDVEVVHTHRYKDNVLGTVAAKLAGVPHVIRTVHGLNEAMRGWSRAKLQAYEALDKAILWCFADRVIAVSKRMAEALKDSGHRPTAVDLRKVRATRTRGEVRRELGIDARALLIGTVGRLAPVKGHPDFLRAARLILKAERGARFLIVGDGPLRDELAASAEHLEVGRACLFLGPRTDIYDLVAAMDIFVLPSLDEGIPMALLEAMALGTPVVATAVGGVPELVTHRATGLLVKPRDERALADACVELARNREWAQTLGSQARRAVEQEFSHERSGHALVEVYRRVVGAREPGGAGWLRRFLGYGRRELDHAVVRRRMDRIRRERTVMAKQGEVVLLEFNELTPSLISQFIDEGRLPNFKRLHDESRVFTTDAAEEQEHLNPWVQWVTVHTGVNAAVHGIRKLGEAAKLKQPGLTELLTDAGRRVLIFGTMNVRYDRRLNGCVVPDPWTTGAEPYPPELRTYYRFVQKAVQEHTRGEDRLSAAEYLAFVRFMVTHGLSLPTLLAIVKQFATELTGRYRWKRVAIMDRIQWDTFRYYYKRVRPHFATFFLNSTAHLQHKYWRNMEPGKFKIKPSAREQAELRNAVRFGYQQMDTLIGRFLGRAGDQTTLIFCTALSQQPCLIYEESGGKTFYKARDIDELLRFVGVREPYAYFPVMSEQFHLRFDDEPTASGAARHLSALRVGDEAALRVRQDGAQLFGGCRIFRQLSPDAVLESDAAGSRVRFFDMFYQAEGIKSGMHHPDGLLWIRLPDRSHSVARDKVPLCAVAPTILRLLGVTPPESMRSEALVGPHDEVVRALIAGPEMARRS